MYCFVFIQAKKKVKKKMKGKERKGKERKGKERKEKRVEKKCGYKLRQQGNISFSKPSLKKK